MKQHQRKILISLVITVFLSACGGGGGGDANNNTNNNSNNNTSNTAPTADAGIDQSVETSQTVALSGSGTDSDGSISTYAWIQTQGPIVSLTDANSANTNFTAPTTPTSLTFELTVTDNDGATAMDEVAIIIVDTTAPTITAINPSDTDTDVPLDALMSATFSEAMDASTFNDTNFFLEDSSGASVAGLITYDTNTRQGRFAPSSSLSLLSHYTMTAANGLSDVAGNTLASATTWQFTTRDASWQGAELVENQNASSGTQPKIAFDAQGYAIAAWRYHDGTQQSVWANRYVPGVGWGIAEALESNDAYPASNPVVAVDPQGNAFVLWTQFDGNDVSLWSNRYTVGTGWGTEELVESQILEDIDSPEVAVDSAGNAIALWRKYDGIQYSIFSAYYMVGVGWGPATQVETIDLGGSLTPKVKFDASGDAIAIWRQDDGSVARIWSNRYTVGSGWGIAEAIEPDTGNSSYSPELSIDPQGNAFVVWYRAEAGTNSVWGNRYQTGAGWDTAEAIRSSTTFAEFPHVAADDDGNAIAVWRQVDGSVVNAYSNRYVPGTGWGTEELIETNVGNIDFRPKVAIDAQGNALAVWAQWDGFSVFNIWSNRYVEGTGWQTAELLESDDLGQAQEPQIAIDHLGRGLAIWQQSDGIRTNILSNRFE